ncbi:hypothetical protein IQ07DRAFT_585113 [Pyrenochaeta sp. DS3sAY3a]|nr:hypothetical protein IQ07DRAFT_585113 [Pyrenochaeta sp. DS3sAY3a]
MNHVKVARSTWQTCIVPRRVGLSPRRRYATDPPPSPASHQPLQEPSRAGTYYKSFGSPVLKCFLGALFTYQLAYFSWLKLETIEEQYEKRTEIKDLQQELKDVIVQQKQVAGEMVLQAVDAVGEVKDKVAEGVKEGANEAAKATGTVGKVAQGGWWPW